MISFDVSKFLPLKTAAINEYKSQISTTSSCQKEPVLKQVRKFLRNKETFFIDN
jgi:hypothetical protein